MGDEQGDRDAHGITEGGRGNTFGFNEAPAPLEVAAAAPRPAIDPRVFSGLPSHPAMNTSRFGACCLSLVAGLSAGCVSSHREWTASLKRQWRQAFDEMKADAAVMASENDGLDAFGPDNAKTMRAARAEMKR